MSDETLENVLTAAICTMLASLAVALAISVCLWHVQEMGRQATTVKVTQIQMQTVDNCVDRVCDLVKEDRK